MGKFDNILIVSDYDGTYYNEDRYPEINDTEIKRFVENGGYFTLSSGRASCHLKDIYMKTPANAPAIMCNGAYIYDFYKEKEIYATYMPKSAKAFVQRLIEKFPQVWIEIIVDDVLYSPKALLKEDSYERKNFSSLDDFDFRWQKALFFGEPEKLKEIELYVKEIIPDDIEYVFTGPSLLEFLQKGVNKGSALLSLAQKLGVNYENTYAIGDYYNDIDMVKAAKTGVAVANACEELKNVADLVVCDGGEGAIAQLIGIIEKGLDSCVK